MSCEYLSGRPLSYAARQRAIVIMRARVRRPPFSTVFSLINDIHEVWSVIKQRDFRSTNFLLTVFNNPNVFLVPYIYVHLPFAFKIHRSVRIFRRLKRRRKSFSCNASDTSVGFVFTVSTDSKRVPFYALFNFDNSRKSHGARSGD